MASLRAFFLAFTITFVSLLSTKILTSPTSNRIVTKLVYRNSVGSPFFDPNDTNENRVHKDIEISLARLNHLIEKEEGNLSESDFQSRIISQHGISLFLVLFEMGEPLIPQAVALDTGSSLFWVHCAGVGGGDSLFPKYNSGESATFSELESCSIYCVNTSYCKDKTNPCNYHIQYGMGQSIGIFASEKFVFKSPNAADTSINLVFGCARDATTAEEFSGFLGLGTAKVSLPSQVGSDEFSYCIGNISDPSYDQNVLIVGKKIDVGGYSIPLIIEGYHYYANIEAISLGGKKLDIDKQQLRRSNNRTGGALIDSGTSFSLLQSVAYGKLEEKIVEFVGDSLQSGYNTYEAFKQLCYRGNLNTDFSGFPTVTLHFADNTPLELDKDNIFQQYADWVCLNIGDAADLNLRHSIIGVNLQQYLYMAFDLKTMELSFQRMDCDALWDDY